MKSVHYFFAAVCWVGASLLGTAVSAAAPILLTTELLPAQLNQPYSAKLTVAATPALSSGMIFGLPPGLIGLIDGFGNVLISGTPTFAGSFNVSIEARNTDGMLTTALPLSVIRVASAATDVSVGPNHACAVVEGGVQCWGGNSIDWMGLGNGKGSSESPVQAIPVGRGATRVSVGRKEDGLFSQQTSCAVVNGGLQCWGSTYLGNGTTDGSAFPVQIIPAQSGVTAVSTAGATTCVVIRSGVQCWGLNDFGQVGVALRPKSLAAETQSHTKFTQISPLPAAVVLSPVDVLPAGSGATAVAVAYGHSCAIVAGGTQCWGDNTWGQLGVASIKNSATPIWVVPAGSNVVSLAVGGSKINIFDAFGGHTCIVLSGGVRCWGENRSGQLGLSTSGFGPVQTIPAGSGVVAVDAGHGVGCALMLVGVECWGTGGGTVNAQYWQTTGSTRQRLFAQEGGVSQVSIASPQSICSIVNGTVRCVGTNPGIAQSFKTPQVVSLIPASSGVTSGNAACAVAYGGLRCLVNGAYQDRFPVGSGISSASTGQLSCIVINGDVMCESGGFGMSANGYPANAITTTLDGRQYLQVVPVGSGATLVATPHTTIGEHACAVVAGGVQCWGGNSYGQIGSLSQIDAKAVFAIAAGSGSTAVAVSRDRSCAVVAGGVKCWGTTLPSEAGVNTNPPARVPIDVIPAGSGVTDIALGDSHTCAVANGGVKCWAPIGRTALGPSGSPQEGMFVLPIPPDSGATSIMISRDATCATVRGALRCWSIYIDGPMVERLPAATGAISAAGQCAVTNGGLTCWGQQRNPLSPTEIVHLVTLMPAPPVATIVTSTQLVSAVQPVRAGDSVTLTARISNSSGSVSTGVVHFKSDGLSIDGCSASVVKNGEARCNAVFYSVGKRNITAEYDGSLTHLPSVATLVGGQDVVVGEQKIFFSTQSATSIFVAHYYVQATASSRLPVTVTSLTPAICKVIDDQPNPGTFTIDFYAPGSCTMRATQAGNASFAAAGPIDVTIASPESLKEHTVDFPAMPTSATLGSGSIRHNASARPMQVTVISNTPGVCEVSGDFVVLTATGKCSLTASQLDNARQPVGNSITRSFDVLPALTPTVVTLTTDVPQVRYADITTLTATITGSTPAGPPLLVQFATAGQGAIAGCTSLPILNGVARCVVPSNANRISPPEFHVRYSDRTSSQPLSVSLSPPFDFDRAHLNVVANPGQVVAAHSDLAITAIVRMRNPGGTVSFFMTSSQVAIENCSDINLTPFPGTFDAGYATCRVNAPASGSLAVTAQYTYPLGYPSIRINEFDALVVSTVVNPPPNYADMWWGGQNENGWGVSITQHGAQQFNVIYAYDNFGKPTWYVMPGCTWNAANTTCTGSLYSPTGAPFSNYDVTRFAANASVGSASFTYKSLNTATMSYTINGISGTKEIERQQFGTATTEPTLSVRDLWWNGQAENGWGLNIAQQGRQLFPVWYTYGTDGKPTFFAVPGGTWNGLVFTGDMYTTTSSPWLGTTYDASKFVATKVGTMVIDFRDATMATITYMVGGVTQNKIIVRQSF